MVVLLSTMMESLVQTEVSSLQVEKSESVSASLALVIEAWRLLCLAKVSLYFCPLIQFIKKIDSDFYI